MGLTCCQSLALETLNEQVQAISKYILAIRLLLTVPEVASPKPSSMIVL
jgi:hypothetical protein